MLGELEWPSLEARRDRSSLLLFHKILGGDVSIEKRQVPDPCSQFENYTVPTIVDYTRHTVMHLINFFPNYSTLK